MPTKTNDPTKRYSDSELDPSNSAFQGMVDNYGATADPTEENQNIANAQNLKDQEASPQSAKSAASADEKSLANPYKYSPGSKKESFTARLSGNKKKIAVLGGGGALGAGFFALFFALLPLKIPGIMQMIADEAGQRVEQATEKRAQMIVGRYILRHAGSNTVITGEGPIATLMASMRTTRFEKKLEQKGLKIERRDGGVRLTLDDGTRLGDGQTFRNEAAIIRALESNNITNKMLKDVVKEEIPSWRWMKRAKFAKWLRIKYGIPRFGIENSKESDTDKKIAEMNANRLTPEYQALTNTLGDATNCTISGGCDTNAYGSEPTRAADAMGEPAEIEKTANDAADELVEEVGANPDTQKTLVKVIVDKLGTKAIPIIGWIDLVATVDHMAYEAIENDYYGKLASSYRSQLYARHYGVWSGYGSQIQLGAMDPEFIGVLAKQTEGVEESQAFSLIEGQPDAGKKVVNKINQNNTTDIVERFREFSATTGMGYEGFQGQAAHTVLNAYYQTLGGGGLLGWLSGTVGSLVGTALEKMTPDAAQEKLAEFMQSIMSKVFDVMGLDFDPLVKGADWFNAAHGGATWSYNDFCKSELGCRKLSASQANLQNNLIAAERAEYRSQQGVMYTLFNRDSSVSVQNQVAIHMPTSAASMLTNIGSIIASAPSNLIKGLTHKTFAAGYIDIHGVDPYGATDDELNQPVDSRAINNEDCGESDGNTTNLCQMDKAIAAAMLCDFKPESEDCEDTATTGGAEDSDDGSGSGASSGEWSLPVARSGWESDGSRWLESHYEGSNAWTNSTKSASDINIGSGDSDCGVPVYSMLSGTIVSNPPSYTMQVKSTLDGKEVLITYAHGKNMKTSGSVSAGDKIMEISNNSRYGGTCHLHLEIKYGDKPICPQRVLPLIANNKAINLDRLPVGSYACK